MGETEQKPKHFHVFLMAAVYESFAPDQELLDSLPEITAPANYKDPVKIDEYIASATERRNAELGDLWPLKKIFDLKICHFDCYETDMAIRPHIFYSGTETQSLLGELHDRSIVLKEKTPRRNRLVFAISVPSVTLYEKLIATFMLQTLYFSRLTTKAAMAHRASTAFRDSSLRGLVSTKS